MKRARSKTGAGRANLMLRLDEASKADIVGAARLRNVSTSDYVREVVVGQARRELEQAEHATVGLTESEQLAFWEALNAKPKLTAAQRKLAAAMRGEE